MQTASVPSQSFAIVPFHRGLTSVARILVVNRADALDFDELSADASDDAITAAVAARIAAGGQARVLAEISAGGVAPVANVSPVRLAPQAAAVTPPADFARAARDGSRGFSQDGADRAAADREVAAAYGIALPPPVYVMGALLRDDGVARAEQLRREYEALPTAIEALTSLRDEVQAEKREDFDMPISALRMAKEIKMQVRDAQDQPVVVGIERDSFLKLQRRMVDALDMGGDIGIVNLAGSSDPELRACAARTFNNVAAAIERHESKDASPTRVTLRTRLSRRAGDDRQAFAVVSDSYGEIDIDAVAEAAMTLPGIGRLRAAIEYDRTRLLADLYTQSTIDSDKWVAGEVYRVGHRFRTDDTGGGSLRVESFVISNLCLNVQIIADVAGASTIIRHMGDKQKLRRKLHDALRRTVGLVAHFTRQWDKAGSIRLLDNLAPATRDDALGFKNLVQALPAAQDAETVQHHAWGQQLLDGVYRSILREAQLVPVRRIEETVPVLRAAHWDPRNANSGRVQHGGLTPAAVSSGLTLWAQRLTPIDAHAVETLAGQIVAGKRTLSFAAAPVPAK